MDREILSKVARVQGSRNSDTVTAVLSADDARWPASC